MDYWHGCCSCWTRGAIHFRIIQQYQTKNPVMLCYVICYMLCYISWKLVVKIFQLIWYKVVFLSCICVSQHSAKCDPFVLIVNCIFHRFVSPRLLSVVVELAHTLWFTNLGRKEGKAEDSSSTPEEKDKPQSSTKCLPLPLINDFLCVLLSVIKHLRYECCRE